MISVRLDDKKVYTQSVNGDNFSLNLGDYTREVRANVLEKIRVEMIVSVGWWLELGDQGAIIKNPSIPADGYFYRGGANWGDTFNVGDTCQYSDVGTTSTFTVSAINGDYLYYTGSFPELNSANPLPDWSVIKGVNILRAVDFAYGTPSTDQGDAITSLFTNTVQKYYVEELFPGVPKAASSYDSLNRAWQNGALTVEYVGLTVDEFVDDPQLSFKQYKITHDLVLSEFITEDTVQNINQGLPPDRFESDTTLKYVFETSFKNTASETTEKTITVSEGLDTIGWLNESFNGFPNNFYIPNIIYQNQDALSEDIDRIDPSKNMRVAGRIKNINSNFTAPNPLVFGVVRIPSEQEYSSGTSTWLQKWVYDSKRIQSTDGAVNSDFIKNLSINILDPETIFFEFNVEYSSDQKALIKNDDNYLIFVHTQDNGGTNADANRVCLVIDQNKYFVNQDIEGLAEIDHMRFYPENKVFDVNTLGGFTNLFMWNEDGFLKDFRFKLLNEKSPTIQSVNVSLAAYNQATEDKFDLQNYTFNLNSVVVDDVQKINIDTTRGYNLHENSQFNLVKLYDDGVTIDGTFYRGQIGIKTNWQEWIELPGANNIFYNINQPFNGKNQKASNYSLKEGYQIRTFVELDLLVGEVTTKYLLSSPSLTTSDYLQEPTPNNFWNTLNIETYTETGTNLQGSIQTDKTTFIKCLAEPNSPITLVDNYYMIARIEETNQPGFSIDELSSENIPPSNNRILPLDGETKLKLTALGGVLIGEGKIDHTKLKPNVNYSLSFRVEAKEGTLITGAYSIAYNKTAYN